VVKWQDVRQDESHRHDSHRGSNEGPSCIALQDRDLRRTEKMYDHCLSEQTFEKPVGVEARDQSGVGGRTNIIVEPAEAKGAHVDYAAGRSEDEYETQEICTHQLTWGTRNIAKCNVPLVFHLRGIWRYSGSI